MKGILGKKLGMTQVFTEDGMSIPVTVIEAGPCVVVQKKTTNNDGYNAIQLGYVLRSEKRVNKPLKGHFDKAGVKPFHYLREFKVENPDVYEVGQEFKADVFSPGDKVDVRGISKGKGFQGSIKRHGFARGRMTHGSHYHRGTGSLAAKGVARVFKGRKMPGHMGSERVTVRNLEIVKVDPERNLLLIKGAVPGPRRGLLVISESNKA
ncbi:MAG: 50S ribosomal protein L3 [Bacillota bacterium]